LSITFAARNDFRTTLTYAVKEITQRECEIHRQSINFYTVGLYRSGNYNSNCYVKYMHTSSYTEDTLVSMWSRIMSENSCKIYVQATPDTTPNDS